MIKLARRVPFANARWRRIIDSIFAGVAKAVAVVLAELIILRVVQRPVAFGAFQFFVFLG